MNNPHATANVGKKLADDLDANTEVVGSIVTYAAREFTDIDERMRFMAMVTIACLSHTGHSPSEAVERLPGAIDDIIETMTAQRQHATIH
jgi:hypothetical protein